MSRIGVVAIGRNEGERLQQCLNSLADLPLVYVDSGSRDDSVTFAKSVGALTVNLDMNKPFTAARARNAGFAALLEEHPELDYVMFVDGDCEVRKDWLAVAEKVLDESPDLAVVCGRRRERFPEATVFNLLCDIEWNTPVGEAAACGGDAVYRVAVFRQVNGFDDSFVAGEEPELCARIRQAQYRVERLDAEMTLHDAAMSDFSQWWKRTERSGYAYMLHSVKHGKAGTRLAKSKELKSITFWGGGCFVALGLSLGLSSYWPAALYLVGVLLQVVRMSLRPSPAAREYGRAAAAKYAFFLMLGKIPQLIGAVKAYLKTVSGKEHTLLEYK